MPSNKMSTYRQDYIPNPAMPIGTVLFIAYATPPDGWLECNGQAISRTIYADLLAKIGLTFGTGNGTTTFNVPDLRGEFIRGWDNSKGTDSGRTFGSGQTEAFKAHKHVSGVTDASATPNFALYGTTPASSTSNVSDTAAAGLYSPWTSTEGGTETRPRNIALMPIIKAMNIVGYDPNVAITGNADTLDGYHASQFLTADSFVSTIYVNMYGAYIGYKSPPYILEFDKKITKLRFRFNPDWTYSGSASTFYPVHVRMYKNDEDSLIFEDIFSQDSNVIDLSSFPIYLNEGDEIWFVVDKDATVPSQINSNYPYSVTASGSRSGYEAWKAFDGKYSSSWSIAATTGIITFDFGSTIILNGVVLQCATATEAPKDFKVQGSLDNSTYTDLLTVTGETSWANDDAFTWTLGGNTTAYRYYRVNITANNGSTSYTTLRNIDFNYDGTALYFENITAQMVVRNP